MQLPRLGVMMDASGGHTSPQEARSIDPALVIGAAGDETARQILSAVCCCRCKKIPFAYDQCRRCGKVLCRDYCPGKSKPCPETKGAHEFGPPDIRVSCLRESLIFNCRHRGERCPKCFEKCRERPLGCEKMMRHMGKCVFAVGEGHCGSSVAPPPGMGTCVAVTNGSPFEEEKKRVQSRKELEENRRGMERVAIEATTQPERAAKAPLDGSSTDCGEVKGKFCPKAVAANKEVEEEEWEETEAPSSSKSSHYSAAKKHFRFEYGSWICLPPCNACNFPGRTYCHRCKKRKDSRSPYILKMVSEGEYEEESDWVCGDCKCYNYPGHVQCFGCGSDKKSAGWLLSSELGPIPVKKF